MIDNRETLSALVAIPSESGNEQTIASYIAERCSTPGNSVDEMADSVVVRIPGQDNTKAFVLNGHTDTVPPTEQWDCDPYTLRVDPNDHDRLIGLGTTDMMSGLAIMLDICNDAQEQAPPCDLWMVFSSREETDGFGSKEVAPWLSEKIRGRYKAIGGLILEPTNAEFVGVGHRGDTVWDMAAHGPGGHASKHFDGETPPIEKLSRVLVDLPDIRRQWAAKYTNTLLGRPSINPTVINAGNAENVVPTQANALLNLRVTPELVDDLPGIREELARIYGISIRQSWSPTPSVCNSDQQIYKAVQSAASGMPFLAFPGATDQPAFHAAGIPMLIYGPGDVDQMHQPNEAVRGSAIDRCRTMVELVMKHF